MSYSRRHYSTTKGCFFDTSVVCPESVLPDWSTKVPDTKRGMSVRPSSSKYLKQVPIHSTADHAGVNVCWLKPGNILQALRFTRHTVQPEAQVGNILACQRSASARAERIVREVLVGDACHSAAQKSKTKNGF